MNYNKVISEMLIKDNISNSFIGKAFSDDVLSDEDSKLIEQSENSGKVSEFFSSIGNMLNSTFNFKRYGGKVYTYEFPSSEGQTINDVSEELKNLLEARVLLADDELKSVSYLGKAIAYGMDNFSENDIDLIIRNTELDIERNINEGIVIEERKESTKKAVSGLRRPTPKTEDNETEEPIEDVEEPIEDVDETEKPIEEPVEEPIEDIKQDPEEVLELEPEEEPVDLVNDDTELILTIEEDLTLTEYELGKMFMVEIDLVFTKNTSDTWKFSVFIGKNNKIYIWKIDTLLKSDTKKFYSEMLDLVTFIINENWGDFQSHVSSKLLDIINLSLTSQPIKYIKEPIVRFVNNSVTDEASIKKAIMNYIILSSCVVNKNVKELGDSYLIATINGVLKSVITKEDDGEYKINETKMTSETLKKFMFACLKIDNTKKTLLYKSDNETDAVDELMDSESKYLKDINGTILLSEFLNNVSDDGLQNLIDDNDYTDELFKIINYKINDKEALYKSERKKAYLKLISLLKSDIESFVTIPSKVLEMLDIETGKYEDTFESVEYDVDSAIKTLTLLADKSTLAELVSYLEDEFIDGYQIEKSEYIPEDTVIDIQDLMRIPKDKSFYELADENQYINGFIEQYENNFGTDVDETYRKAINILFKKLLFELYDNEENVEFSGYVMNDKSRNAIQRYDEYSNIYGNRIIGGELDGEKIIYNADEIVDAINILKTQSKNDDLKSLIEEVV